MNERKKKKEETIPDWRKVGNQIFTRIRERVKYNEPCERLFHKT